MLKNLKCHCYKFFEWLIFKQSESFCLYSAVVVIFDVGSISFSFIDTFPFLQISNIINIP